MFKLKEPALFFVFAATVILLFGCQKTEMKIEKAVAVVYPTKGHQARGIVSISDLGHEVKIYGRIIGLTPGLHGFHIHQFGDASKSDGTSAGGHFNPLERAHGGPEARNRHVGDMGNIKANKKGVADIDFKVILGPEGINGIIGRAFVLHNKKDDMTSQPSGAAGPRVGVGVIGIANK